MQLLVLGYIKEKMFLLQLMTSHQIFYQTEKSEHVQIFTTESLQGFRVVPLANYLISDSLYESSSDILEYNHNYSKVHLITLNNPLGERRSTAFKDFT